MQVPHKTVYDIISDDFLTTGSDSSPDYWKYMIYVFISANWDAILLMVALLTVRWRQLVRRSNPPINPRRTRHALTLARSLFSFSDARANRQAASSNQAHRRPRAGDGAHVRQPV